MTGKVRADVVVRLPNPSTSGNDHGLPVDRYSSLSSSSFDARYAAIAVVQSRVGYVQARLLQAFGNRLQMTTQRPGATVSGMAPGETVRLNQATRYTRRL